jgi:hypothetical protein
MTSFLESSLEDLWQRLFHTQIADARCHSDVGGKRVTLDRRFVRPTGPLEIEFTVQWAWLLPAWHTPTIWVVCTNDDGQELAAGTFAPCSFRQTKVRLLVSAGGNRLGQRLQIRVTRQARGEEVGTNAFIVTTPEDAIRSIHVFACQVLAVHEDERIVCDRLHDEITQLGFNLTLRLNDTSDRSLLTQLGAKVHARLRNNVALEWSGDLGQEPIQFQRADFDWTQTAALKDLQLPHTPGSYQLQIYVAGELVTTQNFSLVTMRSAVAEAQAMVRKQSGLASVTCSAVNHRQVTVPLQVVAEDFGALDVSITLDVPQPNPLISETRHSLNLAIYREGREICREHRRVRIKPGRRRFALYQALSPTMFADGPGVYHLTVWLNDRQLHQAAFEHKTRAQLKQEQAEFILKSLRLSEPRLFTVRDGTSVESPDVFATDEALRPAFSIAGDGFDEDAQALQWRLNLRWRHLDSGEVFDEYRTLVAKAGRNPCNDLELPLHRGERSVRPGRYVLELCKRDTLMHAFEFRILSLEEIVPYTQQLIRRSLRVAQCRLLVSTGSLVYQSTNVPDSADGIRPEFTLHASGFNRFVPSLPIELQVVLERDGDRVELGTLPATLTATPFILQHLLIKVRDGTTGDTSGSATMRFYADEAEIASFPFRVVSRNDILDGISVSAFQLEAQPANNGRARDVSYLDIREHRAISVNLEISASIPAPGVEFAACILLRTDLQPLGGATFDVSPERSRVPFCSRPIPLSHLGLREATAPQQLHIEVHIGGESKGSISIPVHTGQRLTNFEGQLTVDPQSLNVDDAEYHAILRRL